MIAKSINASNCVKRNAFVQNYTEAKALVETIVDKLPLSTTYYSPTVHGVQTALAAVDSSLLRAVSKIMDKKKTFEIFRQQALWIHEAWQKKARNVRLKASRLQQEKTTPAEPAEPAKAPVVKRRVVKAELDKKEIVKPDEVKEEMDKSDQDANPETEIPRQKNAEPADDSNADEEDAE
jgi:hypothetical protein